jgi:phosphohistidine phosphatase
VYTVRGTAQLEGKEVEGVKGIWVMRHGKSDWKEAGLRDFDRPLNKRGRRDAKHMGRWIGHNLGTPDAIISSPALRARTTADQVAVECGYQSEITFWDFLYPGDVGSTTAAVRGLGEDIENVLIVGHNPHSEDLVSWLSAGARLSIRMTTAAVAALELPRDSWTEVAEGRLVLRAFVTPKHLDS